MTRRARGPIALLALLAALAAIPVRADGLDGYVEITGSDAKQTTEDPAGPDSEVRTKSFLRRVNLDFIKRLWPNFRIQVGGFWETNDLTTDLGSGDSTTTFERLRPIFIVQWTTPLQTSQAAYSRDERTASPDAGSDTKDVRETYSLSSSWRPEGLPTALVQYVRTNRFGNDRSVLDRTQDLFRLTSEYHPVEPLGLQYYGSYEDDDNRAGRVHSRTLTQGARVTYNDDLWNDRTVVGADYLVNYRKTDVTASGGGEILFPVVPLAGLSSIDDTPGLDPLGPNPALIDGNRTAGAGVNLGLPPPGGDDRPRNLGLDLGSPSEVNTLRVWIDRELPQEIWSTFSWTVYRSEDNRDWTLVGAAAAVLDPFQTFFELRFSAVTSRYLKVVVAPLAPAVPLAQNYPEILVTELEPFASRPASEVDTSLSRTSHILNASARTRILEGHDLFYELSYFLNAATEAPTNWTVSNGVSGSKKFSDVLSGLARFAREDGEESNQKRVQYVYTAALTIVPLEAFRSSVVFSGRDEEIGDLSTDTMSLTILANARVYRGVDVTASAGRFRVTESAGQRIDGTQFNGGVIVTPHPALTFTGNYQARTDELSGGTRPDETQNSHTTDLGLAFRPLATLYLFASYRVDDRPGIDRRTTRGYTASWSPLPAGSVHLFLYYNETDQSDLEGPTRNFSPRLRWDIRRGSYVEVVYQKLTSQILAQKLDNEILSGTLRIAF